MRESIALLFAAGMLALAAPLAAQQPAAPPASAPCSTSPQPAPCSAPAQPAKTIATPGATDRFPFPGEETAPPQSGPPASDAAKPATAPPDAPAAPSGKAFPFPGEDAGPAAASSSSSSSSSSSDSSGSGADTPDSAGSADASAGHPEGRRLLKRVNPIGEKLQSPDQREAEDLSVAKFYTDTGDLQGAYLRSQDAVKTMPDDPDAHCSLAKAALELKKRDEAVAEFNACLKLDPVEKEAKNARKQLAKLK